MNTLNRIWIPFNAKIKGKIQYGRQKYKPFSRSGITLFLIKPEPTFRSKVYLTVSEDIIIIFTIPYIPFI